MTSLFLLVWATTLLVYVLYIRNGNTLPRPGGRAAISRPNAAIAPPAPRATNDNDAEHCAVYEIRLTQQKMVDAGIIAQHELSVCGNEKCKNCYSTTFHGKAVPRHRPQKRFSTRTKMVNGYRINLPEGVPDHAYPQITDSTDISTWSDHVMRRVKVQWTWSDPDTGKSMGMLSIHPVSEYETKSRGEAITTPSDYVSDTEPQVHRWGRGICPCPICLNR